MANARFSSLVTSEWLFPLSSKKKPLLARRLFYDLSNFSCYFTFKKIITNVNSTRDSMKANPSNIAS